MLTVSCSLPHALYLTLTTSCSLPHASPTHFHAEQLVLGRGAHFVICNTVGCFGPESCDFSSTSYISQGMYNTVQVGDTSQYVVQGQL